MKGGEDSSASRQAFKGGWKCCYGVGELVRQISFTSPGPDDWEAFTCWVVTSAGMVEIAQEGMLTAMAEVGIAHSTLQTQPARGSALLSLLLHRSVSTTNMLLEKELKSNCDSARKH